MKDLESPLHGYGWTPYFVEGSDHESMHPAVAATTEHCVTEIRKIQQQARATGNAERRRWPMFVLRSPKGWTAPAGVDDHKLEGFWRAHQVAMADLKKKTGPPKRTGKLDAQLQAGSAL
jgi:xylulose-5-phosphate/fructose-6-phosphate phosphoketolase